MSRTFEPISDAVPIKEHHLHFVCHFELGGISVVRASVSGVPLFSSACWTETIPEAEEKILAIQKSHWEEMARKEDIGILKQFDITILGKVRSLTRDERRKVNDGCWMNQPSYSVYADIERVVSVRETPWWHIWCENIVALSGMLALMACFFYTLDRVIDFIISLIYG